jgi:hypothetical protein
LNHLSEETRRGEEGIMKLFLSWSGEVSQKVAQALRNWLPYIVQPVRPFLSTIDISKGERWNNVLSQELKDASYGIVCVTPYNIQKPWMNFEAGMLASFFDRSSLTPLLFRVDRSAITGPFSQFQSALCNEDDILSMVCSINYKLGDAKLDHEVLIRTFDVWWKELKKELDSIPAATQNETRTQYEWLYLADDLVLHETRAAEIWIVTSNIYEYALGDGIRGIVSDNLERGVTYRYFLPKETPDSDIRALVDMASKTNKSKHVLNYGLFSKDAFEKVVATDYVIINPESDSNADGGLPRRMFLRLPIKKNDQAFWIEVDERSTMNFKDRFADLWLKSVAATETLKLAQGSGG